MTGRAPVPAKLRAAILLLTGAVAVACCGINLSDAPAQPQPPAPMYVPPSFSDPTSEPPLSDRLIPTDEATSLPTEEIQENSGGFTCRDGTVSHASHRRGACSHHGGIA